MPNERNRIWWPFQIPPLERQTEEIKAKVAFLDEAYRHGFRSYVDQDDCGAIASDGRESFIVWRGKQRAELLLIDTGTVTEKKLFTDLSEAVAFRQASVEALAWLLRSGVERGQDPNRQLSDSIRPDGRINPPE